MTRNCAELTRGTETCRKGRLSSAEPVDARACEGGAYGNWPRNCGRNCAHPPPYGGCTGRFTTPRNTPEGVGESRRRGRRDRMSNMNACMSLRGYPAAAHVAHVRATLAHVGPHGGKAYQRPPGAAGRDVGQRGPPAAVPSWPQAFLRPRGAVEEFRTV